MVQPPWSDGMIDAGELIKGIKSIDTEKELKERALNWQEGWPGSFDVFEFSLSGRLDLSFNFNSIQNVFENWKQYLFLGFKTDYFHVEGSFPLPEATDKLEKLYKLYQEYQRVVISCFEKEHTCCHRHKISDHLQEKYGIQIEHL